jgi:hypothetical protein
MRLERPQEFQMKAMQKDVGLSLKCACSPFPHRCLAWCGSAIFLRFSRDVFPEQQEIPTAIVSANLRVDTLGIDGTAEPDRCLTDSVRIL